MARNGMCLVALILVVGCSTPEPSPSPTATADARGTAVMPVAPLEAGSWSIRGQTVPADVIVTRRGPEHCGWQAILIIALGWPLGREMRNEETTREYVRDQDGLASNALTGPFEPTADLPSDAVFTGLVSGSAQLWFSASDQDRYAYIVTGSSVERWARAPELLACM